MSFYRDLSLFREPTPVIRLEVLPDRKISRACRVKSRPAAKFCGVHTMKNADWLEVVALRNLIMSQPAAA
jgi:hypothetical protein